ncbi:jg16563, partial [Pararge aegeria aegeria]
MSSKPPQRGTVPKMLAALPLWMAKLIRWP